jgi:hypothetical protein
VVELPKLVVRPVEHGAETIQHIEYEQNVHKVDYYDRLKRHFFILALKLSLLGPHKEPENKYELRVHVGVH